ncbi:hypothetical protein PUN28_011224 [Cardiocondyla obscurior]|uniref:Uncharacterized protein n=1 Tax=Cardiocondyla obscurior TaxID=286306 RepID=A0AAW2FLG8_9HYME
MIRNKASTSQVQYILLKLRPETSSNVKVTPVVLIPEKEFLLIDFDIVQTNPKARVPLPVERLSLARDQMAVLTCR